MGRFSKRVDGKSRANPIMAMIVSSSMITSFPEFFAKSHPNACLSCWFSHITHLYKMHPGCQTTKREAHFKPLKTKEISDHERGGKGWDGSVAMLSRQSVEMSPVAKDRGRGSGGRYCFCQMSSRDIPSFRIREFNVDLFIPSLKAAPRGPPTTPLHSRST